MEQSQRVTQLVKELESHSRFYYYLARNELEEVKTR